MSTVFPQYPKRRLLSESEARIFSNILLPESPDQAFLSTCDRNDTELLTNRWIAKKARVPWLKDQYYTEEERQEAAHRVVKTLLTDDFYKQIADSLGLQVEDQLHSGEKINITIPNQTGIKGVSKNYLTVRFVHDLVEKLNHEFSARSKSINVKVGAPFVAITDKKGVDRAYADTFGRLFFVDIFEAPELEPGSFLLLADDHVHSGASMLGRYQTIKAFNDELAEKGLPPIRILGLVSLSALPEMKSLRPDPELIGAFHEALKISSVLSGHTEQEVLAAMKDIHNLMGIDFGTMTNREILSYIAYIIEPREIEVDHREGRTLDTREWFINIAKFAGHSPRYDLSQDSLNSLFEEKAVNAVSILERIKRDVPNQIAIKRDSIRKSG